MKEMIREIEVGRGAKAPTKGVQQVTNDFARFNPFNWNVFSLIRAINLKQTLCHLFTFLTLSRAHLPCQSSARSFSWPPPTFYSVCPKQGYRNLGYLLNFGSSCSPFFRYSSTEFSPSNPFWTPTELIQLSFFGFRRPTAKSVSVANSAVPWILSAKVASIKWPCSSEGSAYCLYRLHWLRLTFGATCWCVGCGRFGFLQTASFQHPSTYFQVKSCAALSYLELGVGSPSKCLLPSSLQTRRLLDLPMLPQQHALASTCALDQLSLNLTTASVGFSYWQRFGSSSPNPS